MFKYTKRLILDIRFWKQEFKLRKKEDAELDRIEEEAMGELRHPMEGFAYYTQKKREREERRRLHEEERKVIK